jgi:uncharacterized paraquat-inducible protein A
MTITSADIDCGTIKATAEMAADRSCPRCRSIFRSEGFGERICSRCKASVDWRRSLPGGNGQGRRRDGIGRT